MTREVSADAIAVRVAALDWPQLIATLRSRLSAHARTANP